MFAIPSQRICYRFVCFFVFIFTFCFSADAQTGIPLISAVNSWQGVPGSALTISGSGFSTTAGNNIVYFGANRATVTAASANALSVVVPYGATVAPISVLNAENNRTGYSTASFIPTYPTANLVTDSFNFRSGARLFGGKVPVIAALADLDNDGLTDVIAANSMDTAVLVIYRNNGGTAGFSYVTSIRTVAYSHSVKVVDMDGDGRPELVAANAGGASVTIVRNTSAAGSISFGNSYNYTTAIQPMVVNVADIDLDGKPDLVVTCTSPGMISVLRNTSVPGLINAASFATHIDFSTGLSPVGQAIGDLDGDGKLDVVIANSTSNNISIFRNTSTTGIIDSSSFATRLDVATGLVPIDVAVGDIDGDGIKDIVVANNTDNSISVFRNNSSGIGILSFASRVNFLSGGTSATGLALADLNGDGKLDISVTNAGSGNISLFRNTSVSGIISAGSLAMPVSIHTGTMPEGIAVGDMNNDTYPDIIVANNGDSTLQLLNNYPLPRITPITGTLRLCVSDSNVTGVCVNATAGGWWTVSDSSIAVINTTTGAVSGRSRGTITVSYTLVSGGDTGTATASLDVLPIPSTGSIVGAASICAGASVSLTASVAGGAWSSDNIGIASVDGTGRVSGMSTGSTIIRYNVSNLCGTAVYTQAFTVTPALSAGNISGAATVCPGTTVSMSSSVGGGIWSSGNISIATVSSLGIVGGVAAGTATISYRVTNACGTATVARSVTVNALPVVAAIAGSGTVCAGSLISLTDATVGGTWTSTNTGIATIGTTGVVGGAGAGSTNIAYTVTNVCGSVTATKAVIVNPLPVSGNISGNNIICRGATATLTSDGNTGGTWSSSSTAVATVSTLGVTGGVAAGTATISYKVTNACGTITSVRSVTVAALPSVAAIAGSATVCAGALITLTDATTGGGWSTSNSSVATISAAGIVRGSSAGNATISYTITNNCGAAVAVKAITVNPLPVSGTITGSNGICRGAIVSLTSNGNSGGTWSSSSTTIATVSAVGAVGGAAVGTATISYKVTNTCGTSTAVYQVTVNTIPVVAAITGTSTMAAGTSTSFTDATVGGVWSVSDTTLATIATSGVLSALSAGTLTIYYSVTNSCATTVVNKSTIITAAVRPRSSLSGNTGSDIISEPAIMLYPNPSTGIFKVKTQVGEPEGMLMVIDIRGKLISQQAYIPGVDTEINISGLAPGVYIVRSVVGDTIADARLLLSAGR